MTTGLSPNQILLGYNPTLHPDQTIQTSNNLVESQSEMMQQSRSNTIWALNKTTDQNRTPPSQYKLKEQVWLEARHL